MLCSLCRFGLKNRAARVPKRCYDAARFGVAAEEVAMCFQTMYVGGLSCIYDGVAGGGEPTKTAMVQFSLRVSGVAEETVRLLCDKACARGPP